MNDRLTTRETSYRRFDNVVMMPAILDDDASQHVEYVPRIVRRRTLGQRAGIVIGAGLIVTAVLYTIAFFLANPDSYLLSEVGRRAQRGWLNTVTLAGGLATFAALTYWQWPRRRRDRDGALMPIPARGKSFARA